jgi:2-polyprenyl-3-methyl-5-hydroxy-6-metoxy-1,4-benzoquinol methylase
VELIVANNCAWNGLGRSRINNESLNPSRAAVVPALWAELKQQLGLKTALDVGCGLGVFLDCGSRLGRLGGYFLLRLLSSQAMKL